MGNKLHRAAYDGKADIMCPSQKSGSQDLREKNGKLPLSLRETWTMLDRNVDFPLDSVERECVQGEKKDKECVSVAKGSCYFHLVYCPRIMYTIVSFGDEQRKSLVTGAEGRIMPDFEWNKN